MKYDAKTKLIIIEKTDMHAYNLINQYFTEFNKDKTVDIKGNEIKFTQDKLENVLIYLCNWHEQTRSLHLSIAQLLIYQMQQDGENQQKIAEKENLLRELTGLNGVVEEINGDKSTKVNYQKIVYLPKNARGTFDLLINQHTERLVSSTEQMLEPGDRIERLAEKTEKAEKDREFHAKPPADSGFLGGLLNFFGGSSAVATTPASSNTSGAVVSAKDPKSNPTLSPAPHAPTVFVSGTQYSAQSASFVNTLAGKPSARVADASSAKNSLLVQKISEFYVEYSIASGFMFIVFQQPDKAGTFKDALERNKIVIISTVNAENKLSVCFVYKDFLNKQNQILDLLPVSKFSGLPEEIRDAVIRTNSSNSLVGHAARSSRP